MKLDGPAWVLRALHDAIAEQRFYICTAEEMDTHGDVLWARHLGLVHVGERTNDTGVGQDRGWFRRLNATGMVMGRPRTFVTRTARGWLDSSGFEYLDGEVRQAKTRGE